MVVARSALSAIDRQTFAQLNADASASADWINMPFYQCMPAPGLVGIAEREAIAVEFTRIHCAATGAPPAFVTVAFVERAEGMLFTAGKPSRYSIISGVVRAGRDRATRESLLMQLSQAWHRITGQDPIELVLGLTELDPTSTMEGGVVMPAPGEEDKWFEQHKEHLGGLIARNSLD